MIKVPIAAEHSTIDMRARFGKGVIPTVGISLGAFAF